MRKLPRVITTSVIRSARQGESHGGVYLVDLESGKFERRIDWNDCAINWEGRGGDRGLRGVALYMDRIYLAASDEIFVYDREFNLLNSYRNNFLRRSHEISISGEILYLTSTDLNSILEFDLSVGKFRRGYVIVAKAPETSAIRKLASRIRPRAVEYEAITFDPNNADLAALAGAGNNLHINNVTVSCGAIMIAGTRVEALLSLQGEKLRQYGPLPRGTHNAAVFREGLIYNDTRSDRVVIANRKNEIEKVFNVPRYEASNLLNSDIPTDHARQGFARGLCVDGDDLIIAGSSPSTISVYSLSEGRRLKSVNISKDIRNCVHGLEIWP